MFDNLEGDISGFDEDFPVLTSKAQELRVELEIVLGEIKGVQFVNEIFVGDAAFGEGQRGTIQRHHQILNFVISNGVFSDHKCFELVFNLFQPFFDQDIFLCFLFLVHIFFFLHLFLQLFETLDFLTHKISCHYFQAILLDPSRNNAIPDVALQGVAVESPDRARHAFENILEVFPVSLEALEQILLDLVLIWERSLGPPIVLVFVGLPLHLVDCLIPCILQKQVLHNLLPFPLNYLGSDHVGLCSAASKPLHAKVVDQSHFSQTLDSLLQL